MSKVPFGFRQDIEPEPEADEAKGKRSEVNCTSGSTERAWQPTVAGVRPSPSDMPWRHRGQ